MLDGDGAHGHLFLAVHVQREPQLSLAEVNATMLAAVPEPKLKQILDQLRSQGAIGDLVEESVIGRSYAAVHKWGDREIRITVTVDESGSVSGLLLSPVIDPHHLPPMDVDDLAVQDVLLQEEQIFIAAKRVEYGALAQVEAV